jgi:hypothetical protein
MRKSKTSTIGDIESKVLLRFYESDHRIIVICYRCDILFLSHFSQLKSLTGIECLKKIATSNLFFHLRKKL